MRSVFPSRGRAFYFAGIGPFCWDALLLLALGQRGVCWLMVGCATLRLQRRRGLGEAVRLESIHEFVVLAETMNYTKTAARLNITQSTLSKHMVELEKETGLSLFNHSVSAPSLTEIGSRFLQRFSVIDAQIAASVEECRRLQDSPASSLRLHNAELSAVVDPVRRSLRLFIQENPRCTIAFMNISLFESVQEALLSEFLDVGFDAIPVSWSVDAYVSEMAEMGLEAYEYVVEPVAIWARSDHPLISRDAIGFEDVSSCSIITSSGHSYDSIQKVLVKIFKTEGASPKFRKIFFDQANDGFTYFSLTEFEDSLMFTTSGMTESGPLAQRPDVRCVIPEDSRLNIRIFILVRKSDELAHRFLEFCKTLA